MFVFSIFMLAAVLCAVCLYDLWNARRTHRTCKVPFRRLTDHRAKLRLQAFAFTPGGTQTTLLKATGNDLSPEMKTFYDKTLIDEAEPNLVHDQFGQERDIPRNGGKTIEFRKFSSLPKASTPITEGVTPAGNSLNVTSITATVSQYGDFVEVSDLLDLTAIDNVIVETTALLGSQAGRTLDTVTREVLQSGTNVFYAPKVAADGAETPVTTRAGLDKTALLRVKDVFRVAAFLKSMNAPKIDGYYVGIIHPWVAYDLMMEAGDAWQETHKYAKPENIFKGEIGELGGVRFVETTEAKIYNDDTCPENGVSAKLSVFGCLFLGANAYGKTKVDGGGLEMIVKQKGSAGTADPLNQRSTVGWKALKTSELLVPEYIVRFECCSTESGTVKAN
ncbi:N4-gp56 family major capsid protein [Ruthenibacterium lactatiformans]|uniref:N4-gp56 family major capsid protein n=1 Tax=Ruthenibacterium lactatiformans TaxID=1550024 RepID=UPI00242E2CC7|nr:N4-gp56 family major capsid protein [Ruthenibacterium lactatiformans]